MEEGGIATVVLLDNVTTNPPTGADALNETVPFVTSPPVTDAGLTETAVRETALSVTDG